jgi:uncharacterized protein (TIGR00369 family)
MSGSPPRPSAEALARYAEEFNQSASMRHFGVRVTFPGGEKVRVTLDPVRPEHLGGLGSDAVNGGVLAAVFDLAVGCAPALLDPTRRTATMQLSMSFLRPVRGPHLWAETVVDSAGGATLFATATVFDAEGNVCARCQGVVKMSQQKWASGSSPAVN